MASDAAPGEPSRGLSSNRTGEDQVRELARLAGISIAEDELSEVANRFGSLMLELDRLSDLDLSDIQPVVIFPEDGPL